MKKKKRSDSETSEPSFEIARKVTKKLPKPLFERVRSDRIDKATRCVCLAIGSVLLPFGILSIVKRDQATGITILMISIPFMVLARWFKKIRIKAMGLEIDAR